ncbi:MAG: large subunit ribosomal protein [Patescibacteria group bacterium]|jgi:large subunit ribosomal protein L24|nr:large subunit ribosomal protein [Patescibacteria group bacterium]
MKFKVGDTVLVTGGKDKGVKGKVVRVFPQEETVIVENANMYTRHIKPMGGRAGEKMRLPRPLPTAKVAIVNDKGEADRIGYEVAKDGTKNRVFKKTGASIPEPKTEAKK